MIREFPDAWIQTFTGKKFWPLEPDPADVDIHDIAHALSNLCRYTGHSSQFYSVAEHSILVGSKTGLHGLMHDAAEAYLGDWSRPLKQTPLYAPFREIEDRVQKAIYTGLGLDEPTPDEHKLIKYADDSVLATEKLYLHHEGHIWSNMPKPYPDMIIECLTPTRAEFEFLWVWEYTRKGIINQ